MPEFVAEHYLSATNPGTAERHAAAAHLAAEQLTEEGKAIELVRSIFIPEDETCIHIYNADSIEAVWAAAARSALRFERISEAVTDIGTTARAGAWTIEDRGHVHKAPDTQRGGKP